MQIRWLLMLSVLSLMLAGCQPAANTADTAPADNSEDVATIEPSDSVEPAGTDATDPVIAPDTFASLSGEFSEKMNSFQSAYRSAGSQNERREIVQTQYPKPAEFAPKFMDLAMAEGDSPDAANCLIWLINNIRRPIPVDGEPVDFAAEARKQLVAKFKDSELIGEALPSFAEMPAPDTQSMLSDLAADSPHESVKAIAKMASYQYDKSMSEIKEAALAAPGRMGMKPDQVEFLKTMVPMEPDAKIALLKELTSAAGTTYMGRDLGEMAADQLFVLENLSVGSVAPDIEGVDFEGESFKLSDYRGKVILLDFWGDW